MWSSCANIRSTAASIKKFYKYLLEKEVIDQVDYDILLSIIKECMPDWLDSMVKHDNLVYSYY